MRPIDADAMLAELKPIDYEMEHSSVLISDVSNIMRNWVNRQPTLTPQNKPLTIKQLLRQKEEPVYIVSKEYNVYSWFFLESPDGLCIDYDENQQKIISYCTALRFINHKKESKVFYNDECNKTWFAYRHPPDKLETDT